MQSGKEISIKSRRDYVMEFSKKTGITDHKVDTFLKMEAGVNIAYDAVILGQERNRWARTTIGVDYGDYAGWTWGLFGMHPSGDIFEDVCAGEWKRIEPDDTTIEEFKKFNYRKDVKNVPCPNPRGRAVLRDIKPY